MKSITKLRIALWMCAILLFSNFTWAQQSGTLQPGWYTIAINGGLSYQQSDVPVRLRGGGIGVTLAKNLVHMPKGGLDFDLRGRLNYSHSFGLDTRRNFDIANNPAVNGNQLWDYRTYPAELNEPEGFIFNNHRTQMAELGIEGVFTLSRLRERTGVVVSGYGGIGLDWYRVQTNQGQLDRSRDYKAEYAAIDTELSKSAIRNTLRWDILDRKHESLAQGFEERPNGRLGFMPYWGVELGYNLSKRWGIGLGHKVTYSGVNHLDGLVVADSRNDIHHYSYAQVWYRFNDKEEEPPIINIIDPAASPYLTRNPYKLMLAEVINIRRKSQVFITHNGLAIPFDYKNGNLSMDLLLEDGINTIVITAENSAGKAQAEQIIILEEPEYEDPPQIRFLNPVRPDMVVNESRYNLSAEILNMERARDIRLLVNGRVLSNFRYDLNSQILTATLSLSEGINPIELSATNRRGQAAATTQIIYEIPVLPPTIKRVIPSSTPHRTSEATQPIRLDITQINTQRGDQIRFMYNGFTSNRFEYDNRNGRLTANLNLEIGQNFLTVTVVNKEGEARLDLVVIREQIIVLPPPPRIVINAQQVGKPGASGNNCDIDIRANVTNVNSKNDITVRIGNSNFQGFTFSPISGQVRIQAGIPIGNTTVVITASNPAGTVNESVVLACTQAPIVVGKPTVAISQPRNNATVAERTQTLRASVTNVNSQGEIRVFINGNELRSFTWDQRTNTVSVNVNLLTGVNELSIRVQNAGGSANDAVKVNYRQPSPPTVVINAPMNNGKLKEKITSFEATVTQITQVSQVTVRQNGTIISNVRLNGNKVLTDLELNTGENMINIEVRNEDGNANASVRVSYELDAPVIIGRIPSKDTTIQDVRLNFSARILNIKAASQVSISLNGRVIPRPTFDVKTGQLSNRMVLRAGRNVIIVDATNAAGKARKEFNVIVDTREPTPPEVKIISASQPAFDPFNPEDGRSIVIGEIKHVTDRKDIIFLHNGNPFSGFTFDIKTGRFEATVPLLRGTNTFVLTATNQDGTRSDQTQVSY